MGSIRAVEEGQTGRGLVFTCDLAGAGTSTITLDWADYNHWCPDGVLSPERLIEAVIAALLEHGVVVPPAFDAAQVRAMIPDADRVVTTQARS